MSTVSKYLLYLMMSLIVTVNVFVVATKPTPITIACLVFSVTNWLWMYRMTGEEVIIKVEE